MSPMPSIHDERNKSNRFEIISASNNQRIKLCSFPKKKQRIKLMPHTNQKLVKMVELRSYLQALPAAVASPNRLPLHEPPEQSPT
jgi:hypothetical protein